MKYTVHADMPNISTELPKTCCGMRYGGMYAKHVIDVKKFSNLIKQGKPVCKNCVNSNVFKKNQ